MKKVATLQKIALSAVVVGALSASAQAVCLTENYCIDFHIGAGAIYENGKGSGAEVSNAAGYVAFGGRDVYFQRVQVGADFRVGYGNSALKGANLATLNASSPFLQADGIAKLGVNILTKNAPLYVNAIVGADWYVASGNGLDREFYFAGGLIEGKIPFTESFGLTYSAGYGFIFDGKYRIGSNQTREYLSGTNQLYLASLGIQKQLGENLGFYFKALGRYYDLKASRVTVPAMNTWQVGIESGITF